jgi:hypothetical protein
MDKYGNRVRTNKAKQKHTNKNKPMSKRQQTQQNKEKTKQDKTKQDKTNNTNKGEGLRCLTKTPQFTTFYWMHISR